MDYPEPFQLKVDPRHGRLLGSPSNYQKKLSDLAGIYRDSAAFDALAQTDGDRVVYAVQDYRPAFGDNELIFGTTWMAPGRVGDEFFMTRGHIHARADRPEIYHGQSGHGLMLMESPEGDTRTVEIWADVVCYVPPFWIHRSVNLGDQPLVMAFTYPVDAGQDYDVIARSNGMRSLIVDDGQGGWVERANPDWRPRTTNQIETIHATAHATVGA
ncbi:glucose-6-phosphate isomerase [Salinisphaera sp.]|uniref:glucose-6-phosphate isomerase n=1 Tax=Salinisphaera sp. TaxID=1914330 RepID=UPI002D76EE8C|nr:glucose-6-phosphate isomerase [Salinisphaera sp.]HET7314415.1 glucose-6-phosphate isomerase [Salinisphaera sp.]